MTPQSEDHNAEEGDDYQLIRGLTTCVDTTLTPPRAQYGATRGNPEQRKPPKYAGFVISCNPLQRMMDHS
jgi:hypothetical protein